MEIIIIAAMSRNRVIGKNNTLPWAIKEDMQHFKELTKGHPCIMGRKTWESLPKKPLPGRLNVVISGRGQGTGDRGQEVFFLNSLQGAIEYCSSYEKVFIIGGESIYKQAMELATKIELTLIHKDYDGDTYFPEINPNCWKIANKNDFDNFSFLTYTRIDK